MVSPKTAVLSGIALEGLPTIETSTPALLQDISRVESSPVTAASDDVPCLSPAPSSTPDGSHQHVLQLPESAKGGLSSNSPAGLSSTETGCTDLGHIGLPLEDQSTQLCFEPAMPVSDDTADPVKGTQAAEVLKDLEAVMPAAQKLCSRLESEVHGESMAQQHSSEAGQGSEATIQPGNPNNLTQDSLQHHISSQPLCNQPSGSCASQAEVLENQECMPPSQAGASLTGCNMHMPWSGVPWLHNTVNPATPLGFPDWDACQPGTAEESAAASWLLQQQQQNMLGTGSQNLGSVAVYGRVCV